MQVGASFFDRIYAKVDDYYGHDVRPEFVRFIDDLPPSSRILEIGSGQGRHALFVAGRGLRIHAVDYSPVATSQLAAMAVQRGLPLTAECADAAALSLEPESYDAVVMISLLSHLDPGIVPELVRKTHDALRTGGRVFIEAFTVDDPGYRGADDASETAGALATYFRHGELAGLFSEFRPIDVREFVEDDYAHGPAHQHGVALFVGEKV